MPRLAGQQPEYLENQLHAFVERRRTNSRMVNVTHVLSPNIITALAAHFKDLNPKPLGGAQQELIVAGKKIYQDGVAGTDIPACAYVAKPGGASTVRPVFQSGAGLALPQPQRVGDA